MLHQVYMGAKSGPFRCSNCEYYPAQARCRKPEIVKILGEVEPGRARVDPGGCSDYFQPKASGSVAERMRS